MCYIGCGGRTLRPSLWLGSPGQPPWLGLLLLTRRKVFMIAGVVLNTSRSYVMAVIGSLHHCSPPKEPKRPRSPPCGASSFVTLTRASLCRDKRSRFMKNAAGLFARSCQSPLDLTLRRHIFFGLQPKGDSDGN